MTSILYQSKMQKSGHGLTLQNGMDRGSFSTFSAVLLLLFLLFHSFVTVNTQDMLNRLLGNHTNHQLKCALRILIGDWYDFFYGEYDIDTAFLVQPTVPG